MVMLDTICRPSITNWRAYIHSTDLSRLPILRVLHEEDPTIHPNGLREERIIKRGFDVYFKGRTKNGKFKGMCFTLAPCCITGGFYDNGVPIEGKPYC
jgi:hypothetical protein